MKEIIKWDTAEYSVKINNIDEQHQKLFLLLNQLYDAMTKGEAHKKMSIFLNELVEYTKYHFGTEEAYFKKYNYPESKEHTDEHNIFANKVIDFQKEFDAGNVTVSKDVLYFLRDWLINHIGHSDQKYSDFLVKHLN